MNGMLPIFISLHQIVESILPAVPAMNSRNNYHAWNTVMIDGQELVVDVSSGDYNNRMDLFVLIPTSEYPGIEKYDTWSVI